MKAQSLGRLFLNAGVLAALCVVLAGLCIFLLLRELAGAAILPLSPVVAYYLALVGIALLGVFAVLFRLHRVIAAAVRHDIRSLTRMFHDVRESELRENYPIALHEFAETLAYLRASGRKLMLEKQRLKSLGLIDHLSQLSNRRYFERRLQQLFETRKSKGGSAVLLIDLDHFRRSTTGTATIAATL